MTSSVINKFNRKLAVLVTSGVGTMACAYLFAFIALISLPKAIQSHDVIVIVSWVAQTFLQLVLLSIIMVGQSINSEKIGSFFHSDHMLFDHCFLAGESQSTFSKTWPIDRSNVIIAMYCA